MPAVAPLYTGENCKFAYQLNWSLTVYWRTAPGTDDWLPALRTATEPDGIRLLQHRFAEPNLSLFLVSTQPQVTAQLIPQRVKGRLQHLLRAKLPKPFQRNYALRSLGSTKREKLEAYLATQIEHHPMADPCVEELFARYQIHDPHVDLSQPQRTAHAVYWYNLHVVLVNEGRWREVSEEILQALHSMLLRSSKAKGHLLSRAALLPDHVHLTLGCRLEESPQDVALSYLNNLAYVWCMRPVFKFSCFVGTFGEYDLGAIH